MPSVAVIILNFNGQKYLPDLLGSIFKFPPALSKQSIIIVDNHSTDGSVVWLKKNYPQAIILEQKQNLGFAAGNNIGIKYAIDRQYDYVMLLNQDTIITEGYLDLLVKKISLDNKIAAVQPKLMLYPSTDLINSLGNVIHYLGFGYTYGHKHSSCEIRDARFEINYCSGAACLLKAEALKMVGFFEEELFMYHEDLDLGWRFKLFGYKNIICPAAVVYHKYEFSRSIKKYYFMERNRFIVMLQNYKFGTLLLIFPALLIMEIGLLAMSFKNGWWKEKLKVYGYFLSIDKLKIIYQQRKKIQRVRIKNDREATRDFSGLIEHQEIANITLKLFNPIFNFYWQIVKHLIFW